MSGGKLFPSRGSIAKTDSFIPGWRYGVDPCAAVVLLLGLDYFNCIRWNSARLQRVTHPRHAL